MNASLPTNGSVTILNASAQKRIFGVRSPNLLFAGARVSTRHWRDVHRRRQVVDHGVEQRPHAFVLQRAAR